MTLAGAPRRRRDGSPEAAAADLAPERAARRGRHRGRAAASGATASGSPSSRPSRRRRRSPRACGRRSTPRTPQPTSRSSSPAHGSRRLGQLHLAHQGEGHDPARDAGRADRDRAPRRQGRRAADDRDGGAVKAGTRLRVDLEVLRIALGATSLSCGRCGTGRARSTGAEVERIVASVGAAPEPTEEAGGAGRRAPRERAVRGRPPRRARHRARPHDRRGAARRGRVVGGGRSAVRDRARLRPRRRRPPVRLGVAAPARARAVRDPPPRRRSTTAGRSSRGLLEPGAGASRPAAAHAHRATPPRRRCPRAAATARGRRPDWPRPTDALARHLAHGAAAALSSSAARPASGAGRVAVAAVARGRPHSRRSRAAAPELRLLARLGMRVPVVPAADVGHARVE